MLLMRGILCFLLVLILSGCTTSRFKPSRQDGPPKRIPHHLIHSTPNAIPRIEPLSRHGNRFGKSKTNSYVALKKRYRVMKSSKGYKARGLASWYGTRFHGRKTSNGEHYDMFAMTAAHPTLPLPTYVKVTNLENRKSVIVKVNDRGPFHGNRLIDLSYVAAAKLGVVGNGTAHVEVVSIDPRDHHQHKVRKLHPSYRSHQSTLSKQKTVSKKTSKSTPKKQIKRGRK